MMRSESVLAQPAIGTNRVPLSSTRCVFSGEIGILKDRLIHAFIPLVRAYIRYAPRAMAKRWFWVRCVDPYFAWHAHEYVASTLFGSKIAGDSRDIVQQYIYYFGVWEPNLTRWVLRNLAPGDVFIDVGANVGYYSLLASQRVGERGSVVAIEASPTTFQTLRHNLALNSADNVRVVNVAVYHSKTVMKLFRGTEYEIGRATIMDDECLKQGFEIECEVNAEPLGAILQSEEMQNARLIKIDVEGAEWAAVQGILPILDSTRSDLEIIMEVDPKYMRQPGNQPADLLTVMSDRGFYAYGLDADYSALSYLSQPTDERPTRIRAGIECCVNIIFSRRNVEQL